jgi:hypothetical protein
MCFKINNSLTKIEGKKNKMEDKNHSSFIIYHSSLSKILRGPLFLFFILISTLISAQETPPRAFATLDSSVVTIGDKVIFHVGVEHDASARVVSATPDMPLDTSKFDVINLGQWGKEPSRFQNYSRTIVFQAFDTGLYRIPSVVFTLAAANGVITTLQSPTMLLTVMNPNGADAVLSPLDIKPIIATEWTFEEDLLPFLKEYLPYFILLLASLFLAWRFWQQRKNRQNPPVITQISQPPHIIAERLLAELRAKQLWQNGKIKEFYSELSHILRGYLEDQFKMPALETTTDELIGLLKKRDFSAEILQKAQDLLQTADLVKFAKVEPPTTIHDDFLMNAEAIVALTKPKPMVIEEAAKEVS